MRVLTGNRLKKYVDFHLRNMPRSRFLLDKVSDYLNGDDIKVCGLYGLRRTGKTVMMLQAIKNLQDWDNCFYITCSEKDSCDDVADLLKDYPKGKFFIDEITMMSDFVNSSAVFADIFTSGGTKVTIAGTDSASILFAKMNALYGRMDLLHTTYIPFAEFKHITEKSIEDYIKYGGTLTNGHEFYNKDSLDEYTNISIVSNIMHSLNHGSRDVIPQRLYDLYCNHELESAINKTIEIESGRFLFNVVTGRFVKSHQWGSVKDLLRQDRKNIMDLGNRDVANMIVDKLAGIIELGDTSNIDETDLKHLEKFLVKLDVLQKDAEGNFIFTQPGMQYCFAEALTDSVIEQWEFDNLAYNVQEAVVNKINQDSLGRILENVIKTDIVKCPDFTNLSVGKFIVPGEGEFDLYVYDKVTKKAAVYEVKRSRIQDKRQLKHLVNKELCDDFEDFYGCRIVDKRLLYRGSESELDGIKYENIETFLCNLTEKINVLVKEDNQVIKDSQLVDSDSVNIPVVIDSSEVGKKHGKSRFLM